MFKKWFPTVFKIVFSASILAWLLATGKFRVQEAILLLTSPWLLPAILITGVGLFLASERWRLLIKSQKMQAGPWETFKLNLIGVFFNYAVPGGVGGDVIKAYYFGKKQKDSKAIAIISVMMDRVLGLYAMIVMALAAMITDPSHTEKNPLLQKLLILMFVIWFIASMGLASIFSRRLHKNGFVFQILKTLPFSRRLIQLYDGAHRFGLDRKKVFGALFYSLLAQSLSILFLWIAGNVAGYSQIPLSVYFVAAPLGYMLTAIPVSPGGIGIGQAAFLLLFNLYSGVESNVGATVITSQQVILGLFGLLGAVFYVQMKPSQQSPFASEKLLP